jgi:hypothetical protein
MLFKINRLAFLIPAYHCAGVPDDILMLPETSGDLQICFVFQLKN